MNVQKPQVLLSVVRYFTLDDGGYKAGVHNLRSRTHNLARVYGGIPLSGPLMGVSENRGP